MSKMDMTIKHINEKLKEISGLDGPLVTSLVEYLSKQVDILVDELSLQVDLEKTLMSKDQKLNDKIITDHVLSPQEYLERVTGKTYAYNSNLNDEERIDKILAENGKGNYSDYPLSEAYILYDDINDGLQFVLVELLDYETGEKYYRFYQY